MKEFIQYVNFVADDATSNALTTDIMKEIKNDNFYIMMTFLEYIEKLNNTFNNYLETDSDLTVDDLVLKWKSFRVVFEIMFFN